MPHPLGRHLFGFAVIADTHLEAPGDDGTIARSNRRLAALIPALVRMQPAFMLHLGDVTHPLPELGSSADAALADAKRLLGELPMPLHVTPGNHDIGDKPLALMPAAGVRLDWIARFEANFGPDRRAFDHGPCRFVMIDAPLLNAGIAREKEQFTWLEREIAAARGKRIFVATHYPLYMFAPDERPNYDNVDDPARTRVLEMLREAGAEAVFTGHIHNLLYNRFGNTELYGLPSVAFVRRDFSELFRVEPLAEWGREDPEKLGFFWVDVHEDGHVARFVRTHGALDEPQALSRPGHPKDAAWSGLGVDLRHPWCEAVDFPFNPPVDAFGRKRVRDDYSLQALCDLGLRDLRIPLRDMLDHTTRARAADLVRLGFRFTGFVAGAPDRAESELLAGIGDVLDALELIALPGEIDTLAADIAPLLAGRDTALRLTRLLPPDAGGARRAGKNAVVFGYDAKDPEAALASARSLTGRIERAGVTFRLPLEDFDATTAARLSAFGRTHGLEIAVLLVWMAEDMAIARIHDDALPPLLAPVLDLAANHSELRLFLDSFMDMDRGYHVRHGLIDRRTNLRPAGRLLRDRHALTASRTG